MPIKGNLPVSVSRLSLPSQIFRAVDRGPAIAAGICLCECCNLRGYGGDLRNCSMRAHACLAVDVVGRRDSGKLRCSLINSDVARGRAWLLSVLASAKYQDFSEAMSLLRILRAQEMTLAWLPVLARAALVSSEQGRSGYTARKNSRSFESSTSALTSTQPRVL